MTDIPAKTFFELSDLLQERKLCGKLYREFLRIPAMSAGVYVLDAGATDPQKPHHEDELYYVVGGRARMRIGEEDSAVGPGNVIFVAANIEHRFYSIQEELTVLVFFAPSESS